MRLFGSVCLAAADIAKVPAGGALAVDRDVFSEEITKAIEADPNITLLREEIKKIPEEGIVIIAAGPLMSDALAEEVAPLTIAGRETITFEYECTLSGQTYKYMQAVTMKDDFYYIFTYTSLAENYDKHLEEVNSIISYITFK
jgi:methylenetetrahydrofolate--tRNA-(uracil-5-)-methyltransferase